MHKFFANIPSGWKSLTGGLVLIVLGIILAKGSVAHGADCCIRLGASIAAIAAGLGIIGLADKAERARSDVEQIRQKIDIMKKQVEGLVDRNN